MQECLFDLLTYPEGLRLRDKLSHGELDVYNLPVQVTDYVITVFVSLCYDWTPSVMDRAPQVMHGSIEAVLSSVHSYKVLFHPSAFLKQQIIRATLDYHTLKQLDIPDQLKSPQSLDLSGNYLLSCVIDSSPCGRHHSVCWTDSSNSSHCPDVDEVVQWLDTMDLPSLYCSKKTVEVLRILRQLMDHWLSVVPQLLIFGQQRSKQWQEKELRSRQRHNYHVFCERFPLLCLLLHCLLIHVCLYLAALVDNWQPDAQSIKCLKSSLQCIEKLHVHTSSSKNKWEEACTLSSIFHQHLDKQKQMSQRKQPGMRNPPS